MLSGLCQLRVEGFAEKKVFSAPHIILSKASFQMVLWRVLYVELARALTLTMQES